MLVLVDEARVGHGHVQQRRLQRHHRFTHGCQQPRVGPHLVDQRAHHLQPQHLGHILGLAFVLHERTVTCNRLGIGAPRLRAERRARAHVVVATLHHRQAAPRGAGVRLGSVVPQGGGGRMFERMSLGVHLLKIAGGQGVLKAAFSATQKLMQKLLRYLTVRPSPIGQGQAGHHGGTRRRTYGTCFVTRCHVVIGGPSIRWRVWPCTGPRTVGAARGSHGGFTIGSASGCSSGRTRCAADCQLEPIARGLHALALEQ